MRRWPGNLQLPQNLAFAAFSNPHLHCIHRYLSLPDYQTAVTMIFVMHALADRKPIATADGEPNTLILLLFHGAHFSQWSGR
jgi:hypothetical protein